MPRAPRLLDRLARVLDRVAALIMVEVVGLAVREQEQEAMALGPGLELGRGVPERRADAGVLAGAQGGDPPAHRSAQGLVEALDTSAP